MPNIRQSFSTRGHSLSRHALSFRQIPENAYWFMWRLAVSGNSGFFFFLKNSTWADKVPKAYALASMPLQNT